MMNEQKRNMKHTGGKQVLCRILAALAVLALLVGIVLPGLGEEAEKAAAIPELPVYLLERMEHPDLAGRMVPLNLSCESEGIRMELLSAAVDEQEALYVYSLQDLEGSRICREFFPCTPSFVPWESYGSYSTLDFDEAEHKSVYVGYARYSNPDSSPVSTLSLEAGNLEVYRKSELYITGMLQKYGENASLVEMPEILEQYYKVYDEEKPEFYTAEDYRNAGIKVLDYKNPLSVRLHKHLDLSGIGVVDGELHVQVHYTDNAFRTYPSPVHSIRNARVSLINNGEYVGYFSWRGSVSWSLSGYGMPDFAEFIFPWDFKEGDHPAIRVEITEVEDIIEGTWKIDVPPETVWAGEGPCPSGSAESTAAREPEVSVIPVPHSEPVILGTPSAGTDNGNPDYIAALSRYSPKCLKDPVPVGLSCEKEGIRLEVTAASVKENAALLICSLQDLEGGRLNDEIFPFLEVGPHEDLLSEAYTNLNYDASTQTLTLAGEYRYDSPDVILDKGQITARLPGVEVIRRTKLSIRGLLDKYGDRAALVDLPELIAQYYGDSEENVTVHGTGYYRNLGMKVLDYTDPLSVRLHKNLELSGIGMIDGQLHVQLHYVDNRIIRSGVQQFQPVSSVVVSCEFAGADIPGPDSRTVSMEWDTDYDGEADFIEYVVPLGPEEAKVKYLSVEFRELMDVIEGHWTVSIPLDTVWTGDPSYLENK